MERGRTRSPWSTNGFRLRGWTYTPEPSTPAIVDTSSSPQLTTTPLTHSPRRNTSSTPSPRPRRRQTEVQRLQAKVHRLRRLIRSLKRTMLLLLDEQRSSIWGILNDAGWTDGKDFRESKSKCAIIETLFYSILVRFVWWQRNQDCLEFSTK